MKKTVVVAVVISAIVTAGLDLLINVLAGSIQDFFTGRTGLLIGLLVATFVITLAIALYLLKQENELPKTKQDISLEATDRGEISDSPVKVSKEAHDAKVNMKAADGGKIKDSGVTID